MTFDLGVEDRKVPEVRLTRPARTPLFRQITFVGLGLINGSIARDVRRLGLAERLVGTARRAETRSEACALGLVDEATPDAAEAVREADLVVLGVPVGASGDAAAAMAPGLRADAVVTDCWVSMGDEDEGHRHNLLSPYQVNAKLMQAAAKDAVFMHCLPAHRGEEVTAEVMDGPQSVVFDEAENRLHAQKGILAWCLRANGL